MFYPYLQGLTDDMIMQSLTTLQTQGNIYLQKPNAWKAVHDPRLGLKCYRMQLSEDEIRKRQRNIYEKAQFLKELGLGENLSSALYLIEDEEIREIIQRHDNHCGYNVCGLDFLSFGLDSKDRLIQFRFYAKGDPSGHCSLDRQTREMIYSKLPPVLQDLLPNKALTDYELREDRKLATMTPEEREAYLKAKEEHMQKYREAMNVPKISKKHYKVLICYLCIVGEAISICLDWHTLWSKAV